MILVFMGWASRPRSNSSRALTRSPSAASTRGHTRNRYLSYRSMRYALWQYFLASSVRQRAQKGQRAMFKR